MPRGINTIQNIFSKTIRDVESGCLLFTGKVNRKGYPRISLQGRKYFGSHIVYAWYYGAIPEGCEIDHRCYNRRCLEPTHLRALSHRENVLHSKTYYENRNHC